jgi:hypothetical protein
VLRCAVCAGDRSTAVTRSLYACCGQVTLRGLKSRAELNGAAGVVEGWQEASGFRQGRWAVRVAREGAEAEATA